MKIRIHKKYAPEGEKTNERGYTVKTYRAEWAKTQPNWAEDMKIFVKIGKNRTEAAQMVLRMGEFWIETLGKREEGDRWCAIHVDELAKLYAHTCGRKNQNPNRLFRQLRLLENRAHKITLALCNDSETDEAQTDKKMAEIRNKVQALFGGKLPKNFGINYDPRGYALKLKPPTNEKGIDTGEPASPFRLQKDWGENQLLAPDFNE